MITNVSSAVRQVSVEHHDDDLCWHSEASGKLSLPALSPSTCPVLAEMSLPFMCIEKEHRCVNHKTLAECAHGKRCRLISVSAITNWRSCTYRTPRGQHQRGMPVLPHVRCSRPQRRTLSSPPCVAASQSCECQASPLLLRTDGKAVNWDLCV